MRSRGVVASLTVTLLAIGLGATVPAAVAVEPGADLTGLPGTAVAEPGSDTTSAPASPADLLGGASLSGFS